MSLYYHDATLTLLLGDALEQLALRPERSVDCVVTSPPYYGLRDYGGHPGQVGLEQTPGEYVERLVAVFAEARRVLTDDGTLWLNLGDSYATPVKGSGGTDKVTLAGPATGSYFEPRKLSPDRPPKNLLGIPWRTAFALQDDGWILRNAIVWHKPNAMPESVTDRLSTRHELLFLFSKSRRYWFDLDAIREPLEHPEALTQGIVFGGKNGGEGKVGSSSRRGGGHRSVYGRHPDTDYREERDHAARAERGRNPGDVWTIPTRPLPEAHFAAFPIDLPRRCIAAGCKPGGTVLDPFSGAGTTAMAAQQLGRKAIGIDINAEYHDIALKRMSDAPLPFGESA